MTNIQNAIKFAESEIRSLELAPKINGCEMTEDWEEQIEVWETAISALEKQIPKKPLDIEGDYTALYGNCPNCKNIVCDNEDYKYCNECGQALDWSDSE